MIEKTLPRIAIGLLAWHSMGRAADLEMNSARGEQLFSSLSCIECHSVNGKGGKIGPDLGRLGGRHFTPAGLASTMWNHAPTMWAAMQTRGVRAASLDEQGAADLFAWFYGARYFERPGDAGRGKALLASKHCTDCHGLTDTKLPAAKPVAQWEAADRPMALVDAMWNHAAAMRQEFAKRKLAWPELNGQELADILVYVRGVAGARASSGQFELGSSERGRALFMSKGCEACHAGKRAPGLLAPGETLTDAAAAMWNHAPRMGPLAPSLDPSEMLDVATFIWAQRFFTDSGNPGAGKRVFASKHCTTCHEEGANGAAKLTGGAAVFTGASMVSALWQHGPQMLEQMKSQKIPWPRFDGMEMSNLIAYLNARKSGN